MYYKERLRHSKILDIFKMKSARNRLPPTKVETKPHITIFSENFHMSTCVC